VFSILVSRMLVLPLLPSESKTEKGTGVMRQYHPAYRSYCRRWFCCGRERQNPGCMEAKHIDDRISGELDRVTAIRESAREEANAVVYRNCEECERDVEVDFFSEDDVEDFETEEKEKEEQEADEDEEDEVVPDEEDTTPPKNSVVLDDQHTSPDQNVPPPEGKPKLFERGILDLVTLRRPVENVSPLRPERFLCYSCEEKAAAKGENGGDEEFDFYNNWYPF
jgi:hypothetical protein